MSVAFLLAALLIAMASTAACSDESDPGGATSGRHVVVSITCEDFELAEGHRELEIAIDLEGSITVDLCVDRSDGLQWFMAMSNPSILEVVEHEFIAPDEGTTTTGKGPVIERWVLAASERGDTTVEFRYAAEEDVDSAVHTVTLLVQVG